MIQLEFIEDDRAAPLRRLEDLWPKFAVALQVAATTHGGMCWRPVRDNVFLVRFRRVNGKTRIKTIGPRGPKTEAILADFRNTVGKSREIVRRERPVLAQVCRVAKDAGLARLPDFAARILTGIWTLGIDSRLTLFGGAALHAYESQAGVLAPFRLIQDDHLQFVTKSLGELDIPELEQVCDLKRVGTSVVHEDHRIVIRGGDRILCQVFDHEFFQKYLTEQQRDVLADALDLPAVKGLTVSSHCRPVQLSAMDPRAYAMAAYCLRASGVWKERSYFTDVMVQLAWPDPFLEDQELLLEGRKFGRFHGI